jgi:hypothetical protein
MVALAASKPRPTEMAVQSLSGSCEPSSRLSEAPRIWLAMPSKAAPSHSEDEMRPATLFRLSMSASVFSVPPMLPFVADLWSAEYVWAMIAFLIVSDST